MRYFIELSYTGTNYHGWQVQENAHTVQAELERALCVLLKTTIPVVGCGRTDTGVHAEQFFAHFETSENIDGMEHRLNGILPEDIAVKSVFPVAADTHARFSATERVYRYLLSTSRDPFLINRCYFFYKQLDMAAMNDAASILLNYNDFSSFSKSHTQTKTNLCEINYAKWEAKKEVLEFTISANRFLRNMVRAIVGTLLDVGTGKLKPTDLNTIIESKNRSNAGVSVPAEGLYLHKVIYPKELLQWQA